MLRKSEDETPKVLKPVYSRPKTCPVDGSSFFWLYCQFRGERRIMPNAILGQSEEITTK
jgi:hypothetical protein